MDVKSTIPHVKESPTSNLSLKYEISQINKSQEKVPFVRGWWVGRDEWTRDIQKEWFLWLAESGGREKCSKWK